jgi:hypothetical protein
MVRRTVEAGFEKVLFVSLNYDLLLDSALERYGGEEFEDIDSYISVARKWSFVKPHGSANWARILENCPKYGGTVVSALPAILSKHLSSLMESKSFDGTGIRMTSMFREKVRTVTYTQRSRCQWNEKKSLCVRRHTRHWPMNLFNDAATSC